MDYIPKIITASEARQDFYRLIERASESDRPIVITSRPRKTAGKAGRKVAKTKPRKNVVLISEDEWNSIKETLYLYSIPGMVESIKKAAAEPLRYSRKGSPFDD